MTHSPANAEKSGGARKSFIAAIKAAYAEYRNGMGATAFAQEVGAALRELDRRAGK